MPQKPHPDYYRILQVHPQAEQEVIEGAYRRLMRKYHPDSVNPGQRDNPEIQRRVREINEAYAILGDPAKRRQYDKDIGVKSDVPMPVDDSAIVPFSEKTIESRVEKLIYEAKCAKTKRRFQMLLARRKNSGGLFRIIGYQNIPESGEAASKSRIGFPTEGELEAMFERSPELTMDDIDWGDSSCPDCQARFVVSSSRSWRWFKCGNCSHLFCAGDFHKSLMGFIVGKCPWCGAIINFDPAKPRQKAVSTIRGGSKLDQLELGSGSQNPKLPEAKGGKLFNAPGHASKEKRK
jgi:curved DNA-binding protein CbpA